MAAAPAGGSRWTDRHGVESLTLSTPVSLRPGTRLGPYEIVSTLGAGGMGEVYRADDSRLGRAVALKLLPPDVSADEDRRQRFLREARAAARLTHPNVATVYDVGEADGRLYLAMELVDGRTLPQKTAGRPLPVAEILEIGAQVADAPDEAHRAGVVHRDTKPTNIMVDSR
jgi:serine/threonine protein kinase